MSDYDQEELFHPDAIRESQSSGRSADIINAAIERAAMTPFGSLVADDSETLATGPGILAQRSNGSPRGSAELPPVADAILLDVLPVSIVSSDDLGRPQIAPDGPSLRAWERTDRETAEQLISWVNESGTARDAIAKAITGGSDRFERLSIEYDDRLARAGYDRSAPEVQACDREMRELHEDILQAKDVLEGLRDRREALDHNMGVLPEHPSCRY